MYSTFLSPLPGYVTAFQLLRRYLLWFSAKQENQQEPLTEDEQLVLNAQNNPQQFGKIYEKYYDQIFIYVSRRVGDYDVTGDLCSNVFMASYKNLHKFEFRGFPLSSWLYKIALNEINMYFRSQKKALRHVNIHDEGIGVFFEEMSVEHEQFDRNKLITHFLETLESDELLFLELRFFEKRSFKEIGYLLKINDNTAKVKTYRILGKLKKQVKHLNWEDFKWQK